MYDRVRVVVLSGPNAETNKYKRSVLAASRTFSTLYSVLSTLYSTLKCRGVLHSVCVSTQDSAERLSSLSVAHLILGAWFLQTDTPEFYVRIVRVVRCWSSSNSPTM